MRQPFNLKTRLNNIHVTFAVLIAIVCGLIIISYGWISFATFTKRPGLNGDFYNYYRIDRIVFAIYELLVALGALFIITRLSFFVYKGDVNKVIRTFIYFAIFFTILIISEIYLNTRFVGKG